ncbi:MAG: transporter [Hyphomicrobium sp.]
MVLARCSLLLSLFLAAVTPASAIEGAAAAGPIGGTDIRSAQLPPPGLYGGNIFVWADGFDFLDGDRKTIPALREANLTKTLTGPFLVYVPNVQVMGGTIGFAAVLPYGEQCGKLFAGTQRDCVTGLGDPYFEIAWSRSFGTLRPSQYAGAAPIFEGLSVLAGIGLLVPLGKYDAATSTQQGLSVGNNIFDVAPTMALTYMTPPILAEGTELSAKVYWNNYDINADTGYLTGDFINIDFALTERIGRFQIGLAGVYAFQVEDDELFGTAIPPDGRRVDVLNLGGVINYDMPEYAAALKFKALFTDFAENAVRSKGAVIGWYQKF